MNARTVDITGSIIPAVVTGEEAAGVNAVPSSSIMARATANKGAEKGRGINPSQEGYSCYYVDVSKYSSMDIYRVLKLYKVYDPCIQHAIKKLLAPGLRGSKQEIQDIKEAIVSLTRAIDMRIEDESHDW